MLRDERIDKIMELLNQHKYLSVDFLVNHLHYSPATVRRDITLLEKMGYAKKSYGGICLNEHSRPLIIREHELTAEKNNICREASKLVKDNDVIFVAGSSTTFHLGKFLLNKKDVTVITTDIKLALNLEKTGVRCYCTGGLLHDGILSGSFAVNTLKQINYDICFFSASGVTNDGEICVVSEEFGTLIKEVCKRSVLSVCLCDDSKIGKHAFFSVGYLDSVSHIISNAEFDKKLIKSFKKTNFCSVNE